MMSEFKDFAMLGNLVDMAVGIVIGGAFGKIVSSFVGDVLYLGSFAKYAAAFFRISFSSLSRSFSCFRIASSD